ncbi:hypothetical protein BaRGS_00040121, partial [Batillaria attramentaria]
MVTKRTPPVDHDEFPVSPIIFLVASIIVAMTAVVSVYVTKRTRSRRPAESTDEHSEGAPRCRQPVPSRPGIPSLHSVHIDDVNVSENT